MKKLIPVLLAMCLLCGCSTQPKPPKVDVPEDADVLESVAEKRTFKKVNDKKFPWTSGVITLDGNKYTLGNSMEDFVKNGWKSQNSEDEDIPAKGSASYNLTDESGEKVVAVTVYNDSDKPTSWDKCALKLVHLDETSSFKFDMNGIAIGDTYESVKAKFGDSWEEFADENSTSRTLIYRTEGNKYTVFFIFNNGKLSSLDLYCLLGNEANE